MKRFCPYCLEEFHSGPNGRQTCGKELCRSRTASWNTWVRNERTRAVSGDVSRPQPKPRALPAFGGKAAQLFDIVVEQFRVTEHLEVAA